MSERVFQSPDWRFERLSGPYAVLSHSALIKPVIVRSKQELLDLYTTCCDTGVLWITGKSGWCSTCGTKINLRELPSNLILLESLMKPSVNPLNTVILAQDLHADLARLHVQFGKWFDSGDSHKDWREEIISHIAAQYVGEDSL